MHRLAEIHSYSLHKASVRLAKERGKCAWFDRTKYADGWLPIDTANKFIDTVVNQPLLCVIGKVCERKSNSTVCEIVY